MTIPHPTMIRKVKNGISTGGRSCGGKSVRPISFDVKLMLAIRLPRTGTLMAKWFVSGRRIGERDQDLARRLLVVPAPFDRRKLRRLVVVDEVADEMTEKELRRHEDCREIEAHAQHDPSLGLEIASAADTRRPVAATQKAPVRYEASSICGKRTQTTGLKMILPQSVATKSSILERIADRRLHPAVVDHDPESRECGAQRDHRGRKQVEPRRNSLPAEQKNAEEARLERKGREGLVSQKRPLYRPRHARELAPVGAELEGHHDAGDDTEPEGDAENLEPELEKDAVRRSPGREMQRLEHGQPSRQSDRERWKDDVERDGESELQPRQQQC